MMSTTRMVVGSTSTSWFFITVYFTGFAAGHFGQHGVGQDVELDRRRHRRTDRRDKAIDGSAALLSRRTASAIALRCASVRRHCGGLMSPLPIVPS